jgi:aminoglycoside phosphotransferase (APT) family kinase protein
VTTAEPGDAAGAGAPAGIAVDGVTVWYRTVLGAVPPLRFERLAGGHSNLTYRVSDASGTVTVLRRPPEGELLPSAHDMTREWRAISALGPTAVPVAPELGFCPDPAVTGATFYVMGFVPGAVLHDEADAARLPETGRRAASRSLAEVLAALHDVDVGGADLSDLGWADGYVPRQLRRWYAQYRASGGATPLLDQLHDALAAGVPDQQRTALVHGDYRLGNVIVGADHVVAAVLDWEICTLGDPLADLGYLLATWAEPGDGLRTIATSPSGLAGFGTRDDLARWYAAGSSLDLAPLPYYLAFNLWKVACINQGVWARYDQGQTPAAGVDVAAIRASVDALAERAAAAFDGWRAA